MGIPRHPLEALQQGPGPFGIRGARDVVGHGHPQRHRRKPEPLEALVEHAHDPGRALVAGAVQTPSLGHSRIGGGAGHQEGPGVGNVGYVGAHGHQRGRPGARGELDNDLRVGAPAQLRLRSHHQHQVALPVGRAQHVDVVGGPNDLTQITVLQPDSGPLLGEVEELLRVDVGHPDRVTALAQPLEGAGRRAAHIEPALECGHQHRRPQLRKGRLPHQVAHPPSMARIAPGSHPDRSPAGCGVGPRRRLG